MKYSAPLLLLLLLLNSCKRSGSHNEAYDLSKLKPNWIEVELREGKWVLYQPCDADIFTLQLSKNIVCNWGQEGGQYKVVSSYLNADSSITITTLADSDVKDTVTFNYKPVNQKSLWTINFYRIGVIHDKYLIPAEDSINYVTVLQPCSDCWDEADCDSIAIRKN